jgi:hypothetical protein
MKKAIPVYLTLLLITLSCSQTDQTNEATTSLNQYVNLVDSIVDLNNNWKRGPDSNFIEIPYDTNDFSKTMTDTIVISVDQKKNMNIVTGDAVFGRKLMSLYTEKQQELKALEPKMNQRQKDIYQEAKIKFENILKDSVVIEGF